MPRWRREPLVYATIDLYPPSHACVRLEPAAGRWPEHETSDRLTLGASMVASALCRVAEPLLPGFRGGVKRIALSLARSGPGEPGDEPDEHPDAWPRLVDWDEPGRPRMTLELARSSIGPVPRLGHRPWSSSELSLASFALVECVSQGTDRDERLSLALTLEGVLGWYRDSDPSFQPPQQAVAFALRYAGIRFVEAGQSIPQGLERAAASHRAIRPMSGGA